MADKKTLRSAGSEFQQPENVSDKVLSSDLPEPSEPPPLTTAPGEAVKITSVSFLAPVFDMHSISNVGRTAAGHAFQIDWDGKNPWIFVTNIQLKRKKLVTFTNISEMTLG